MLPQDGTYGGTPTPRNDSAASVSTAAANTNEACTITGDRQFGSTWRATMTTSETPSARAASTYIVSRITSTEPRTMRATRGAYTIPMATMTLATLGPSEAISAMARMMAGKAMSPSITRITGLSSRRQYPAASPQTSPTAKASSTTAAPTSSESRAPYTTRLHTSRPTSSVPNQCAAPGAVRRADTSMRSGSPAMTGASTPTSVVTASSTRPTTVARRRTSRESQSARRRTGSAGRGRARTLMPMRSLVSHPRIEHHVREVHGQVHEHVEARDAEHHALDHGIVAAQHGRDDQPAEPGNVEDLLHDDRAGDEDRERDADDGDRRDHGVLQRMLVDDGALAQAARATGHDELLAQHVEHGRARDARDERRLDHAQHRVERQQDRRLRTVDDRLEHRAAQEDGLAEVAARQASVPAEELDVEGRVEAQLALDAHDVVGTRVGTGDDRGGIAGGEVDEHEGHRGHDQDDREQREQAPRDVRLHARRVALRLTSTARRSRGSARWSPGTPGPPCGRLAGRRSRRTSRARRPRRRWSGPSPTSPGASSDRPRGRARPSTAPWPRGTTSPASCSSRPC